MCGPLDDGQILAKFTFQNILFIAYARALLEVT